MGTKFSYDWYFIWLKCLLLNLRSVSVQNLQALLSYYWDTTETVRMSLTLRDDSLHTLENLLNIFQFFYLKKIGDGFSESCAFLKATHQSLSISVDHKYSIKYSGRCSSSFGAGFLLCFYLWRQLSLLPCNSSNPWDLAARSLVFGRHKAPHTILSRTTSRAHSMVHGGRSVVVGLLSMLCNVTRFDAFCTPWYAFFFLKFWTFSIESKMGNIFL